MSTLLETISSFFTTNGRRTTEDGIRLQFFSRSNKHDNEAHGDEESAVLERTTQRRWGSRTSTLFYSSMRLLKFTATKWDTCFPGWRSGVAGFLILATSVLMINISFLIWTATHLDDWPYATIAVQSKKKIDNWSFWAHLAINVSSAALLAGSNYCMQCLSSPTRKEVDVAHSRLSYLNIGILSYRNVLFFRRRRICLVLALLLSSVPLHLLYNSSLAIHGSFRGYGTVLVTPEFLTGGPWIPQNTSAPDSFEDDIVQNDDHDLRILQDLVINGQAWNRTRWSNVSTSSCIRYVETSYEADHGSVLLVVEGDNIQRVAELVVNSTYHSHLEKTNDTNQLGTVLWMAGEENFPALTGFHELHSLNSYCLSLNVRGTRLRIHLWFLLTVVVLNAIKLACFLLTIKQQRDAPLMTVGDAVASFLETPDRLSKGMCLISEGDLETILRRKQYLEDDEGGRRARKFTPGQLRYYHSVSFLRWTIYASSCMLIILMGSYLYNSIIIKLRGDGNATLWSLGFGKLDIWFASATLETPWCYSSKWRQLDLQGIEAIRQCERDGRDIFHTVVASIPQLIVSTVYVALNHQLTVMVQLRDWARLATRRQPLRVSSPEPGSDQVSTYWLSLPYRYSISLLISSIAFSWLLSQALFVYRSDYFDDNGYMLDNSFPDLTGIGFSPLAVLCSLVFGIVVFGVSVAIGFQKCAPGMPLGPTNSLIIAAACHPPENDRYAARKLVKWGAISTRNEAGAQNSMHHCTITSRRVENPVEGRWYA